MNHQFFKTHSRIAIGCAFVSLILGAVSVFSDASASRAQVSFSTLSANQKNLGFTPAATVTIGGHLRNVNQRGLSGETVNLTGSATATTQTIADGSYSFTVTSGGDYSVAPNDSRVSTWNPLNN